MLLVVYDRLSTQILNGSLRFAEVKSYFALLQRYLLFKCTGLLCFIQATKPIVSHLDIFCKTCLVCGVRAFATRQFATRKFSLVEFGKMFVKIVA